MEESTTYSERSNILQWTSDKKYMVKLLCWTTGLLNIFHSPQLFLTGGFTQYLFIYSVLMLIIGIPLTFMELSLGQYSRTSNKPWDICPLFKGIGYSKLLLSLMFQIYYNVLNSYILYYAVTSLSTSVKWTKCREGWANSSCYDFQEGKHFDNLTGYQSSVEQFWYNKVLRLNMTRNPGWPNWYLVVYLCIIMVIVSLANCRGSRLLETFLPPIMMVSWFGITILLFITLVTLGGFESLIHLLTQKFNLDLMLPWNEDSMGLYAFQDLLYSMGLGLGGFSSFGAQNSFRKPIHIYAIFCNLANIGLSLAFAIILFNLYKILSLNENTELREVMQHKTEFSNNIFSIIPSAICYLPGLAQWWIFVFYTTIFLQGLNASIVMCSSVLQLIYEFNPHTMKKSVIYSFIYGMIICLTGSALHTRTGIIITTFLNKITYTTLLPLINTIQILVILYFYGLFNFIDDTQFMLGFRPSPYWQLSFVGLSFLLPTFTVLSMMNFFSHLNYKSEVIMITERCILSIVLLWIPFMAMVTIIRKGFGKMLIQPSEDWGPDDNTLRKSREMFTHENLTDEYIYERNLLKNKLSKYENDT